MDIWHIIMSFYQHHFTSLCRPHKEGNPGDSSVDLQGDHTGAISHQHYAHPSSLARELQFINPEVFVKLSKLHHATLGIDPIDPMWTDEEMKTPLIQSWAKWKEAERSAHGLVMASLSSDENWSNLSIEGKSQVAERYLQQLPFICMVSKVSYLTSTEESRLTLTLRPPPRNC